jgi:two-component system, response regulator YesN
MKILIVEDEVNAREGLGGLLGKLSSDYIVCGKASDGEQGLILAKEFKPDLIFVDIEMPKLNGLQMIEKIKEGGQEPYFIILSGYSDFKYAQKGIKLGVEEYLLKPITYNNLRDFMVEMNNKYNLKKEEARVLRKHIPKEEMLREIILNKGKTSEDAYKIIENNIKHEENMYLINFYLRETYRDRSELIIKEVCNFMEFYKIKIFYYSIIREYNYLAVFINTKESLSDIIKMLKYNLLFSLRKNGFKDITVSAINLKGLGEVKSSLSKLQSLSTWPIVLGNDEIIHEELILKLKINDCIYPREIENEVLVAIKNNDYEKSVDINKRFISYLKAAIYNPVDIIEICGNYVFSILTFLKGCNNNFYEEFKKEGILDHIRSSCTLDEIKENLDILIHKTCKRCDEEEVINSLPVRKTINYIKEFYKDRVSLEEIASSMNITPEHLSRLFTKELGKNFSDYLKEYRINQAKKLLAKDKMKIYEIAERVGYSDPKYFCKVFKEVTGMSPKEYMKIY